MLQNWQNRAKKLNGRDKRKRYTGTQIFIQSMSQRIINEGIERIEKLEKKKGRKNGK